MSLFSRIWSFIRRPTGYIGKDFEGNYFYEHASATNDPRRTRRVVRYKGNDDLHEVASRSRQLAVQWKAWLTHTRMHPPSLEELQADVFRRQRLSHNVALIEERDRNERVRLAQAASAPAQAYIAKPDLNSNVRSQDSPQERSSGSSMQNVQMLPRKDMKLSPEAPSKPSPWVPRSDSDEPQAWSPRAARRGS